MVIDENEKFEQWARQINASDEGAFSELFHAVYPRLVKYAWQFTRQKTVAHDIVQEVFMKLWEGRAKIEPSLSLLSYLYKMVKNQALNYLRDNQDYTISLDELSPQEDYDRDKWSPETQEQKDENLKMLTLIDALPNRQREALKLSRFEGLSHNEIAHVMQISARTVNNHIVTAINALKKDWNNHNSHQKKGFI